MDKLLAICNGETGEPMVFGGHQLYSRKIEQAGVGYEALIRRRHFWRLRKLAPEGEKHAFPGEKYPF